MSRSSPPSVEHFQNISPQRKPRQHSGVFSGFSTTIVTKKTTQNQSVFRGFPAVSDNSLPIRLDFRFPFVKIREFSDGHFPHGRVAERSNAPDSKSGIRLYRIEGSNPSPSAREPALNPDSRGAVRDFLLSVAEPQKNGRSAESIGELTDSAACLFGELYSLHVRLIPVRIAPFTPLCAAVRFQRDRSPPPPRR